MNENNETVLLENPSVNDKGTVDYMWQEFVKDFKKKLPQDYLFIADSLIKKDLNPFIKDMCSNKATFNAVFKNLAITAADFVPYAGSIISTLITIFWPSSGPEDTFAKFREQMEKMVDEKIEEQFIEDLNTHFITIKLNINTVNDYLNRHSKLNADPPFNSEKDPIVKEIFTDVAMINDKFVTFQMLAQQKKHQKAALPTLFIAMNTYFAFLKMVLVNKEKLKIDENDLIKYRKGMEHAVSEMQAHFANVAQLMVDEVKNKEVTRKDVLKDYADTSSLETNWNLFIPTYQFNRVEEFLREKLKPMLDVVARYHLFDYDKYPTKVYMEDLSRIFSPVAGAAKAGTWNYDDIFNTATHGRSFLGDLTSLAIRDADRIDSIQEGFIYEPKGNVHWADRHGGSGGHDNPVVSIDKNTGLWAYAHLGLYNLRVGDKEFGSHKNDPTTEFHLDETKNGYKLSSVYVLGALPHSLLSAGALAVGWIDKDVTTKNTIYIDGITSLSSQKYMFGKHSNGSGKIKAISELARPGNTTDLRPQTWLDYKIVVGGAPKGYGSNHKFKVRYLLAGYAKKEANITLTRKNENGEWENLAAIKGDLRNKGEVSSTEYWYLTEEEGKETLFTLEKGEHEIAVQNTGGLDLYLDRIEFVPVNLHNGEKYEENGEIYYRDKETNEKLSGWQPSEGKWYYFDTSTKTMVTGWQKITSNWYYLSKKGDGLSSLKVGEMAQGWQKIDGSQYYFGDVNEQDNLTLGQMEMGWSIIDGIQYYFSESGDGLSNFKDGEMVTGEQKLSENEWYYLSKSGDGLSQFKVGEMATGWVDFSHGKDLRHWKYYSKSGDGLKNWKVGQMLRDTEVEIEGVTHFFGKDGYWR